MNLHAPPPTVVITVNVWNQVSDSSGQHQPSAFPRLARYIDCLEISFRCLLHALDFCILKLNCLVARKKIVASLFAKLSRLAMILGKYIVHVSHPFVTVDARIEHGGGVKLAGKASGYREASGAATDDENIKKRSGGSRDHGGALSGYAQGPSIIILWGLTSRSQQGDRRATKDEHQAMAGRLICYFTEYGRRHRHRRWRRHQQRHRLSPIKKA